MPSLKYLIALAIAMFFSYVSACADIWDVKVTFYGYPDNDPAGSATAYSCGDRNYVAGGTGTYDDPVTFATAPGEYEQCEIIYLPYLKKYARFEDYCAQCTTDYDNGLNHIDIWTGSSSYNGGDDQVACEYQLTPDADQSVVRYPDTDYEVDISATYDYGTCNSGDTYPDNDASNYC
ncbi:hypothetical protein BP5796_08522 [Coleophoma crateriformis]|uniref:Uncharacterized protein n=1 Tax=Coleophoma crateriformis TaxID=565419 RepID=A0A3D8R7U4_9HELO|nr:hypothetical protein BP5796_08522 [Coleophoma crateriformis]